MKRDIGMRFLLSLIISILLATGVSLEASTPAVPAFPGAEGFGAFATGGRGGRVIKVTNLNASGRGSLQDAVSQSGPRIVVFDVSGEILGDVIIRHGNLTIAGQTAPGAGITIRGKFYGRYRYGVDNIVVRHIRVRPLIYQAASASGEQLDGIQFSRNRRLIFDHISVAWGVDETVDFYNAKDVTLQWSTIEESLTEGHPKGGHNYGFLAGPGSVRMSLHHNLFAHHRDRAPAIASGPAEVINNLIYNVRYAFVHHNPAKGPFNIWGNFYKRGPKNKIAPFNFMSGGIPGPGLSYYLRDNCIDDPGDYVGTVDNPWRRPLKHSSFKDHLRGHGYQAKKASDFSKIGPGYVPVTSQGCKDTFNIVLKKAGAFPRDIVTSRTIRETRNRTGAWGGKEPLSLMAGLKPGTPLKDSDNDGMPDSWEKTHGLNPGNGKDHNKAMPSGYTAIEEYINELAEKLSGGYPPAAVAVPTSKKTKRVKPRREAPPKPKKDKAKSRPKSEPKPKSQPEKEVVPESPKIESLYRPYSTERHEILPLWQAIPILTILGLITQPAALVVLLALVFIYIFFPKKRR